VASSSRAMTQLGWEADQEEEVRASSGARLLVFPMKWELLLSPHILCWMRPMCCYSWYSVRPRVFVWALVLELGCSVCS
jgi:hypothetical protein